MRITFVLPTVDLSGGFRVAAIHAHRLMQMGHEVLAVSVPRRRGRLRVALRSLTRGKHWARADRANTYYFDSLAVPCRVLEKWRPISDADLPDADVVVATWWETAEWVAALSPSKGAKAYFIQGDDRLGVPEERRARVAATWRLPMHMVAVSRWLADVIAAESGKADVSLVPNGVDAAQFFAPPRQKQDRPTVGFVYASDPIKGMDTISAAIRRARAQQPTMRVLAFGAEQPSPGSPLPEGTEFHFQPPQESLNSIYASCDAWLFASRVEGFGLPVLEAMACRTPVIGTPAGAAPELIGEGGGILIQPGDGAAMADAILKIARIDQDDWRAMSDSAYATAQARTWENAAMLFEKALRHCSAGRGGLTPAPHTPAIRKSP